MKRGPAHFLAVTICIIALLTSVGDAHAQFFKKLFTKDLDKAPSSSELQKQEKQAAVLLAAAEHAEASGNSGKALSLSKKASLNYPLTESAGKAQFKVAELMEKDGKLTKSFDEYQDFITTYRQSPQFSAAIERQFKIASTAMDDKASSFLGLKTSTPKSQVIEMFDKVIANAPRTPYAAQSQFRIGEIHQKERRVAEATDAFQKVVDDYPGGDLAAQAAYRMANINLATVERSKDSSNVRTARSDLESAVSLFPESEQRSDAIEALSTLDETEAAKSMSIANFYQKRGNSKAAAIYYLEIAKSGTTYAPEAREKLNEIGVDDLDLGPLAPGIPGGGLDPLLPSRDDGASAGLLGGTDTYSPIPTVKTRPDYLGPPAPGLDKLLEKPRMRTNFPPTFSNPDPNLPPTPTAPSTPANELLDIIDTQTPLTDSPASTEAFPDAPKLEFLEDNAAKALEELEEALEELTPAEDDENTGDEAPVEP
ncbi:MAG: outer membrane assembly lipoprotein YfiO [Verrucomicrobiales bacterium]|jgi:outer membrane assembly lipoprotein YfiO